MLVYLHAIQKLLHAGGGARLHASPHDDSSSPLDLPLVYNRELQLNTMRLLEKVASLPKLSIFNKISS